MFSFLVNVPWCRRTDVSQSTSDYRYEQALLWEAEEPLVVPVCHPFVLHAVKRDLFYSDASLAAGSRSDASQRARRSQTATPARSKTSRCS